MTLGKMHLTGSIKRFWFYGFKYEVFFGNWGGIQRSLKAHGSFAIGALMFRPIIHLPFLVVATNHRDRR